MNRDQARALITQTFTHAFDKARFRNFAVNLLNHVDEGKAFARNNQYNKAAFRDHVNRFERLGTYTSPDNEKLDVLIVHLTTESKLERARTAIRNFVADHLKTRDEKDAALVAFVSPTEKQWRFSYVKMEYATVEKETGKVAVETRLTPARRFSYIVGEGESCHTAQTRFLGLLQDTQTDPKLADMEEAFSVEAVTKEFFKRYAELFGEIHKALEKLVEKDKTIRDEFQVKNVNTVDFAKKLMGQIVFLYFLQKKGWLGVAKGQDWGTGPHDFLRRLANGEYGKYDNFFNDLLEPLFYDTLATDRGHEAWCNRFKCRIPFLNGGLFEPLGNYNWKKTDILLSNSLFTNNKFVDEGITGTGVLDVFDRYNFTVNEAEPLEKEVAIDPEMLGKVFENLIEENLRKGLGSYYTPREIVHYMCQESLINYLDTTLNKDKEIVLRTDIETFVHLGEQFSFYEAAKQAGTIGRDYPKPPKSIEQNARLIDEKLSDITVCDPAVGSGAFPVGMMTEIVRARCALTTYFNDVHERTPYHFKRHAIQNCLYGVDIDPGAIEIAKLRLWLSLVVDEEDVKQIKPLPNLDYKIVAGNSLIGFPFKSQGLVEIERLKQEFFDETDHEKKAKLKSRIDEQLSAAFATSKKSLGYEVNFDFEIYFSEIFYPTGGFDVVIGNPPHGADLSEQEKSFLDIKYCDLKSNTKNSAIYFAYRAKEILDKCGVNAFIVPKALCYSQGWGKCASFMLPTLLKLIDIGKAFEKVKLEQVIFIKQEAHNSETFINGLYEEEKIYEHSYVPKAVSKKHQVLLAGQSTDEIKLLMKIVKNFPGTFREYVSIERGLNWQSRVARYPGKTPVYRGAQLSPYQISEATDFAALNKFDESEYRYQLRPKIVNQLAIAHVKNPYPHFFLQAALDTENRIVFETISCTFVRDKNVDIKFILGLNNSKLFAWLLYKFIFSNAIRSTRYDEQYVGRVPCPDLSIHDQSSIVRIVDRILTAKQRDPEADTTSWEREIDRLVYELYGLTEAEIEIVEGSKQR